MLSPQMITHELLGTHVDNYDNRTEGEIRKQIEASRRWQEEELEARITESKKHFPLRFLPIHGAQEKVR